LGYEAAAYHDIARILTEVIGQPFSYEARPPEEFYRNVLAAGAEPSYMKCVFDSYADFTGVTVLQGAVVNRGVVIGVGAFVHGGTVVPNNFFVPPNTVAVGNPLTFFGPSDKTDLLKKIESIKFPKIAYDVDTILFTEAVVASTKVRAKEFESHAHDIILEEASLI
jgi:hypothetical protein